MKKYRSFVFCFVIICGVLFLLFKAWANSRSLHEHSATNLERLGVDSFHQFEDPIGPNWIYTWENFVPGNGYFSKFFATNFCIRGDQVFRIENIKLDSTEFNLLANLVNMKYLTVVESELPDDWIRTLAKCRDLESLKIRSMSMSQEDVRRISELRIKKLLISNTNIAKNEDEFVEAVVSAANISDVELINAGFGAEDISRIERSLEEHHIRCSVEAGSGSMEQTSKGDIEPDKQ